MTPSQDGPLRLVVADDGFLVREGIRQTLAGTDEVEVLDLCSDLPSLLRAVEGHRPDVVLTDIRMPPTGTDEGIQAAETLRETHPTVGVIVISQYVSAHYVLRLFEHGLGRRGYLLKERVAHRIELLGAIRDVANGGSAVDPKIVEVLVEARARDSTSPLKNLSVREREVLTGIAAGKSNGAIAESLFLTKRAVEKNINSIFGKLDLHDDTDVSRRVVAALLFLADTDAPPDE